METQHLGSEFGQFSLSLRSTLGAIEKQDLDALLCLTGKAKKVLFLQDPMYFGKILD